MDADSVLLRDHGLIISLRLGYLIVSSVCLLSTSLILHMAFSRRHQLLEPLDYGSSQSSSNLFCDNHRTVASEGNLQSVVFTSLMASQVIIGPAAVQECSSKEDGKSLRSTINKENSAGDESWLHHLISSTLKGAGSPLNHHQVCGRRLGGDVSYTRVLRPDFLGAISE
ncbi:uncharacterized protein LOC144300654 [Canis aureus]